MHAHPTPIAGLQPLTPPALERVVLRCLAKDPENRVQTARDLVLELTWIAERTLSGVGASAGQSTRPRPPLWTRPAVLLSTVLAAVAAGALGAARYVSGGTEPRVMYASILPPEGESFSPASASLAVSPDGRQVTFVASAAGGKTTLWVRRLDSLTSRPLAGTDDPIVPVANGRILASLIPDARLATIDDGHLFLVTSATESAAMISKFLS